MDQLPVTQGASGLDPKIKISIFLGLFMFIGVTLFAASLQFSGNRPLHSSRAAGGASPGGGSALSRSALPLLLDLGADYCPPCRKQAPVLDGLKEEFAGRLRVRYIDVQVDSDAAQQYGVRVIPTQIFIYPRGEELYRHEGFFSRDAIVDQWRELGYPIDTASAR